MESSLLANIRHSLATPILKLRKPLHVSFEFPIIYRQTQIMPEEVWNPEKQDHCSSLQDIKI